MIFPYPADLSPGMPPEPDSKQLVYKRLKSEIDRTYPAGHLVALDEAGIIADAADFDAVLEALRAQQRDPRQTLVVCAGSDDLDHVTILCANEFAYAE